jgi:peptidoglycan/xylan/chitin deacetylase (PgdA/CDA1 family)
MRNTRTGSIILEHDGGGNRSQTVAALKLVIPRLQAHGYHFATP